MSSENSDFGERFYISQTETVDANITTDGWHFCDNNSSNLPIPSWNYLLQVSTSNTKFQMSYNTLSQTLHVRNKNSSGIWNDWIEK